VNRTQNSRIYLFVQAVLAQLAEVYDGVATEQKRFCFPLSVPSLFESAKVESLL
jgi:hypothetical protein